MCRYLVIAIVLLLSVISGCQFEQTNTQVADEKDYFSEQVDSLDKLIETRKFEDVDLFVGKIAEEALEKDRKDIMANVYAHQTFSYILRRELTKADSIGKRSIELADESGVLRSQLFSRKWYAEVFRATGEVNKGLAIIDNAIIMLADEDIPEIRALLLSTRAMFLVDLDRYHEALSDHLELAEYYKETESLRNLAVIYNSIGLIYVDKGETELALDYFKRSYDINIEINNIYNISMVLNNMGMALKNAELYEASIDTLHSALRFNRTHEMTHAAIQNMFNLSNVYIDTGDLVSAKDIANEGLRMSREMNFPFGIMYHSNALAKAYAAEDDYQSAYPYTSEAYDLAKRLDIKSIISEMALLLSNYYEKQNEFFQALNYFQEYHEINAELTESKRSTELSELIVKYNVEQKESENQLLQENLEIQKALNKNQQQLLLILGIGVFVTLVFLYFGYKGSRRLRFLLAELEDQKDDISRQNAQLEKLNNDRNALIGVIVHDLKNPLSSIMGVLDLMKMNDLDKETFGYIDLIDMSTSKMSSLIDNLLDIKRIEKKDIRNDLEINNTEQLTNNIFSNLSLQAERKDIKLIKKIESFNVLTHQDYVGRILDNLVSNAIKFSEPGSSVYVSILKSSSEWKIVVDDEGPGIKPSERNKLFKMFSQLSARPTAGESSSGIGLYNVSILCQKLGGKVELVDKIGKGARFECSFPILNEKEEIETFAEPLYT